MSRRGYIRFRIPKCTLHIPPGNKRRNLAIIQHKPSTITLGGVIRDEIDERMYCQYIVLTYAISTTQKRYIEVQNFVSSILPRPISNYTPSPLTSSSHHSRKTRSRSVRSSAILLPVSVFIQSFTFRNLTSMISHVACIRLPCAPLYVKLRPIPTAPIESRRSASCSAYKRLNERQPLRSIEKTHLYYREFWNLCYQFLHSFWVFHF